MTSPKRWSVIGDIFSINADSYVIPLPSSSPLVVIGEEVNGLPIMALSLSALLSWMNLLCLRSW